MNVGNPKYLMYSLKIVIASIESYVKVKSMRNIQLLALEMIVFMKIRNEHSWWL